MPFIPAENVVKLEAVLIYGGQYCENVYNYQLEVAPTAEIMEDLAAAFKASWNTNFKPAVPATCSLVMIRCTDLSSESGPAIEYTTGLPIVGTQGNPQLPNNVTFVVKWTTALRGRSYRGRTYHVGLAEDQVVGNSLGTGYDVTFGAIYADLISLFADVYPAQLVVLSRYHNNAPRSSCVATPVLSAYVDTTLDSQRRRLPGRGN